LLAAVIMTRRSVYLCPNAEAKNAKVQQHIRLCELVHQRGLTSLAACGSIYYTD